MKTIIAGSRDIQEYEFVKVAMNRVAWVVTEVVSGMARGVDKFGLRWAHENDIPVKKAPADWEKHGKAAGFIRNREMAEYAEALVAVWDGKSRGTKNMITEARARGLKVLVCLVSELEQDVREEIDAQNPGIKDTFSEGIEVTDTKEVRWKGVKLRVFDPPEANHATVNFALAAMKEIDRLMARVSKLEEELGYLKARAGTPTSGPPRYTG